VRDRRVNWRDDDQGFRDWARLGYEWQRPVLDALLQAGLPAVMPRLELREHVREAKRFYNQADILVGDHRIEVKSVAFEFRRARDWPHDAVRMDPVMKWLKKHPRPLAYVFISRKTRAMLAVRGNDEGRTGRAYAVEDRERGTKDRWVTMPREDLVSMNTLIAYLQGDRLCF
jgi:hypothetical protein